MVLQVVNKFLNVIDTFICYVRYDTASHLHILFVRPFELFIFLFLLLLHVFIVHLVARDGNWGAWTATPCSATCGAGRATRVRSCDNPAPSNGGSTCVGDAIVVETCEIQACNGTSDNGDYGDAYVSVGSSFVAYNSLQLGCCLRLCKLLIKKERNILMP